MENNTNILNPIKVLCGIFNIPLSVLGKQLGVSRQAVSLWVNGKSVPTDDNLMKIEKLYGIDISILRKPKANEDDVATIHKVFIDRMMPKKG